MEDSFRFICGNAEGEGDFVYDIQSFVKHVLRQGQRFITVAILAHNGPKLDSVL